MPKFDGGFGGLFEEVLGIGRLLGELVDFGCCSRRDIHEWGSSGRWLKNPQLLLGFSDGWAGWAA